MQLVGVVIRNNELRDLVNYGIDLDGMYQGGQVQNNRLTGVAGNAVQIAGQGIVDSQVDHNLIIGSGPSKIYPGAVLQGAGIGPNAWYSSGRSDAFATSADVVGSGDPGSLADFGRPLAPPDWERNRESRSQHLGRA